jgi:hypothetical protein
MRAAALAPIVLLLAACGDPGNRPPGARAPDQKTWQGAAEPYVAPGWTPGDAQSWDEQMRKRVQGQNEYTRIGS